MRSAATASLILLGAGAGDRLGLGVPKALIALRGRPMAEFSLAAAARSGVVYEAVLVVPPASRSVAAGWLKKMSPLGLAVDLVEGGRSRQESVVRGLSAIDPAKRLILVHDAARPFASAELFERVLEPLVAARAPRGEGRVPSGVVPVVPSPDTVKRLQDGFVLDTVPRARLGLAQTPQAFLAGALRESHARVGGWVPEGEVTDDAMLLERCGHSVAVVQGEASNFKVTTQDDLRRAEWMARRLPGSFREPTVGGSG